VRVTPQGNPINSFVIAAVSGVQTHPSLIFNGTDYITVWSDCRLGRYYINSTRITPSGTIPGPNYWIGIAGTNDEDSPDIAYNGNHSLCVWSEENTGVKGRFIDNLGQPEDTVLTIAFFTSTTYTSPALASDGDNFLIVWYERRSGGSDWDILGQLVSAQGSLIGTPITIATGGNSQYDTDVVFDGVDYFVVWRETTYHIYGRRIDVNGNFIGPVIHISEPTSIYRYQPTLVNSHDNYLIAWSEWRGSYFDIYGNVDIETGSVEKSHDRPLPDYAVLAPTISLESCHLQYTISRKTRTQIFLYDASGRCLQCLLDAMRKPGEYELNIPTQSLATGVYFISISTDAGTVTKKLTVIR